MKKYLTYKTKGGFDYIPEFVESLSRTSCIACGRCFKSCPQGVLGLKEVEEDDDDETKYMEIKKGDFCIGCKACAKSCPKGCFTHKPMEI